MSSRTAGVAVAVSARTVGSPSWRMTLPRLRYAGRKSWPHCEMQCASSTTNSGIVRSCKIPTKASSSSFSGVTKTIFSWPDAIRAIAANSWSSERVEFSAAVAVTPRSESMSSWSFISAISGETTIVVPSMSSAGSW